MKFILIKKKWVLFIIVSCTVLLCGWLLLQPQIIPTITTTAAEEEVVYHVTTGELKTTTDDGKEIEAYFWNPGTIVVPQGKNVTFNIYGVNGKEHSFYIEGTDIKGTVKKGEEIKIETRFNKEGTYRIICLNHADIASNGPMIGYIVVD
ncbi:cupredoxin domain-containing protein [Ferdinandcohnia quinoae]|uniref:Cupredoxin domain-containing protein n=1 Tax=Fredinandcohnia quinoae TaxID=2918902 RepID=A0AAW5E9I5_9BACI|nr:cupredoxin domain-containing protein [Fredinandcohnia sp. SECRCQ15]MCH1626320.1 cupredoxin domain-containing protein [Fredinandcohnia sp. SECRCQ15]